MLATFLSGRDVALDWPALHDAKYAVLARFAARITSLWKLPQSMDPEIKRQHQKIRAFMHHILEAHLEAPRAEVGDTFLGSLVARHHVHSSAAAARPSIASSPGRVVPDELITDLFMMLAIGSDPVDKLIAWTIYYLSLHRDWEARVVDEAKRLEGGPARSLERQPHLKNVLREVLRLTTPYALIVRGSVRDLRLGEYRIPRGCLVLPMPQLMHTDPRFWHAPARFDPSRFERESTPHAFLPFGEGIRGCLGASFAMPFAALAVSRLLTRYRFDICPGRDHSLFFHGVLRPAEDIRVRVESRRAT